MSRIARESLTRLDRYLSPGRHEYAGTIRFLPKTFTIVPECKADSDKTSVHRFPLRRNSVVFHTHPNRTAYAPPSADDIVQMAKQYKSHNIAVTVVFTASDGAYVLYLDDADNDGSRCCWCAACVDSLVAGIERLQKRFPPGKRYNSAYRTMFRRRRRRLDHFDKLADTAIQNAQPAVHDKKCRHTV